MRDPSSPQAGPTTVHSQGLTLGDVQYIFFRHKWLIALVFLAGVAAAAGIFFVLPAEYQSEAKILIRYIESPRRLDKPGSTDIILPDRGESVINSQIEILTSSDRIGEVVDAVLPEKILAKVGGGNDRGRAISVVAKGLLAEAPRRGSSTITARFKHPDPTVVQPVLRQLVEIYRKKQAEIYQGDGQISDRLTRQADDAQKRLSDTEDELKRLYAELRIVTLEDSKRAFATQSGWIHDELLKAKADLAERTVALGEFARLVSAQAAMTNVTTNIAVPAETAEQYRLILAEAEMHKKLEQDLLRTFGPDHPRVKRARELIAGANDRKKQLEDATPELLTAVLPQTAQPGRTNDLAAEATRLSALQARIAVLTNELERITADQARVAAAEPTILQLLRQRESDAANLQSYRTGSERIRLEESLSAGKITNVEVIQNPSSPFRDMRKLYKPMGIALLAGLFGGFALAFVLERVLSQTIKRVADLERTLRVPMLLSVPDTSWRKGFRFGRSSRNGHQPTVHADAPPPATASGATSREHSDGDVAGSRESAGPLVAVSHKGAGGVAPWDADHELRAHYEALRDRLITYFEVRNMTHKPKLVALTSCHKGAGVTTMAAGLAAALSETGDGNVLLVDMNLEQGAAHPFHRGKPAVGLSEAFEAGKHETAMVNENLYLVSAKDTNDQKLPRVLPRRFANLVPKMKASDYDYIIFDMPPVAQTSITPRLSSFMDIVMMVVESEKTGQELAKRATTLLQESKANVTAVLNKNRDYVPESLRQEL